MPEASLEGPCPVQAQTYDFLHKTQLFTDGQAISRGCGFKGRRKGTGAAEAAGQ